MNIILGSSSPWRQQVLKDMGYQFSVLEPGVDEKAIRDDNPERLAVTLAIAKNEKLKSQVKEPSILITADQVVVCGDAILEKPQSEKDIYAWFEKYAKDPVQTVGAIVVTNTETGITIEGVQRTKVTLKPIPHELIEDLIKEGSVLKVAGGIRLEDPKIKPYINSVEGELEDTMGMPRALTKRLIEESLS